MINIQHGTARRLPLSTGGAIALGIIIGGTISAATIVALWVVLRMIT